MWVTMRWGQEVNLNLRCIPVFLNFMLEINELRYQVEDLP